MEKTEFLLQTVQQLREEIVSTQKIRAQIIGFKLTYVTAGIGYIFSQNLSPLLLIVVAFVAILFDFLITGQSISIKRAGYYIRSKVGPVLQESQDWLDGFQFWEEFMTTKEAKGGPSALGNLGQTMVVFVLAFASPFMASFYELSYLGYIGLVVALLILTVFMIQNIRLYRRLSKYSDSRGPNFKTTLWQDLKWFWGAI